MLIKAHIIINGVYVFDKEKGIQLNKMGYGKWILSKRELQKFVIDSSIPCEQLFENKSNAPKFVAINDALKLSYLETMYLETEVEFIEVYKHENDNLEQKISKNELFQFILQQQPDFITEYAAFRYFRNLKWIVRSGIKFGCNFLLYNDSMQKSHSLYMAFNVTNEESDTKSKQKPNWNLLFGRLRISTQVQKKILYFTVKSSSPLDPISNIELPSFNEFYINVVILSRWKPDNKYLMEEEEKRKSTKK